MKTHSKHIFNPATPAYLFVTPHMQAEQITLYFLQTIFCTQNTHNTSCSCTTCTPITYKTDTYSLWIKPDKRYVLDDLESITHRINFMLEEDQKFFFIIQDAQFLTPACANMLLKIVEEPPAGYYFIFLASHSHHVLPTLRSRCVIHAFTPETTHTTHPELFYFFTKKADPLLFLKEISALKLSEHESTDLLNALYNFWVTHYKKALTATDAYTENLEYTYKILKLFEKQLGNPIMPGSQKLFWKNLFLQKEAL